MTHSSAANIQERSISPPEEMAHTVNKLATCSGSIQRIANRLGRVGLSETTALKLLTSSNQLPLLRASRLELASDLNLAIGISRLCGHKYCQSPSSRR